jgi:CHAD domain-containing protein
MRGNQPIGEASLEVLNDHIRKAARKVKLAARGDADGVHDLRVAIRKIRAALSILRETLIGDDVARKEEAKLARLFSALGWVRDNDVMAERVLAMGKDHVTDEVGKIISKKLHARGRRAKKRLGAVIRKDDPVRLLEKILTKVARAEVAATRANPAGDDHRTLVRHHAGGVLVRRFELVLAFEVVVPGSLEDMHRLRVAIKQLRYALDFFADALGGAADALDRVLERAQNELGEVHDHHVAADVVARAADRSKAKDSLARLRDAEDAIAKKLLERFAGTWQKLCGQTFSRALLRAIGNLLAPERASSPRSTHGTRNLRNHDSRSRGD